MDKETRQPKTPIGEICSETQYGFYRLWGNKYHEGKVVILMPEGIIILCENLRVAWRFEQAKQENSDWQLELIQNPFIK